MADPITVFPIQAQKASEQSPVATMYPSDSILLLVSGANKRMLLSAFKTLLAYQPFNGNLSTLAGATPSAAGLNLLSAVSPDVNSYPQITLLGSVAYKTAEQLMTDLRVNGGGVDRTTAQALAGKIYNGLGIGVGTAVSDVTTPVDINAPSDPYLLKMLKVGFTGGEFVFEFTKTTRVRFPPRGLLATVTKQVSETPDDTKASASSLNLNSTEGALIEVTGGVAVNDITLSEGSEKVVRFSGILQIAHNVSLVTLTRDTMTTAAGDVAYFRGLAGGVVLMTDYTKADGTRVFVGDVYLPDGAGHTLRLKSEAMASNSQLSIVNPNSKTLTMLGDFSIAASGFYTTGAGAIVLNADADSEVDLPTSGLLTREVGNYSATNQTPTAATRTYVSGSAITIPASKMKQGTKLSWKFNMLKSAAGTATSTIEVCVGTNGTTADVAVLSFTKPAGTAAADEGFVIVEAVVKAIDAGTSVMLGEMVVMHNLAATGHMTIPVACVHAASGGTDDFSIAGLKVGLCITTGASDAITINQVAAQAFNI